MNRPSDGTALKEALHPEAITNKTQAIFEVGGNKKERNKVERKDE